MGQVFSTLHCCFSSHRLTNYSYGDTLDNLIQTNQGGQIRTFEYDDKGRLKSEILPESGKTDYEYSDFDAVKTRTDARGVVTPIRMEN